MTYYILGGLLFITILFFWMRCRSIKKALNLKNSELQSLQQKTEGQFKAQQDYISLLSQELRIPLYGIMGLTTLIAEEHPEIKENKKLKSLKFTGDYLLTLINNVLHVNYLDSEEVNVQNIVFDLKEVTQNLTNSFSYATENSDNILEYDFDEEIDQKVVGDPALVSQILINLLSNALRFTKNGNVQFSINLIKKKENTFTISFKVSHNGYEVSQEDQKSIYQEFINIDQAKASYLGTGLNSRIVKKLAKVLGGEIIIENNTKSGSEYAFVIDFKIHNTVKQITEIGDTPEKTTNAGVEQDGKLKALIVDDNKLNLLVADKMLSKENFICTTIDNGFDAIDLAKENHYDIILMDINMPKLNGIGTTKKIREFDPKTPIIALTAVDVTQLNRQIIHAGLNDYILKPYNKNNLLEIINKHLNDPAVN